MLAADLQARMDLSLEGHMPIGGADFS
ncbi:hypothetical protein SBBP1_220025 [Burkholderiales bacterium]|nr:hypothetical protein SBBP1_220025 [Burkholderiales bacterium]